MTLEEAKRVGILISTAGQWKEEFYVEELVNEAARIFPEFDWTYNEKYEDDNDRVIVEP